MGDLQHVYDTSVQNASSLLYSDILQRIELSNEAESLEEVVQILDLLQASQQVTRVVQHVANGFAQQYNAELRAQVSNEAIASEYMLGPAHQNQLAEGWDDCFRQFHEHCRRAAMYRQELVTFMQENGLFEHMAGAMQAGATAGFVGGTIGSFILPGIGTAVGMAAGALAGHLFGQQKQAELNEHVNRFDNQNKICFEAFDRGHSLFIDSYHELFSRCYARNIPEALRRQQELMAPKPTYHLPSGSPDTYAEANNPQEEGIDSGCVIILLLGAIAALLCVVIYLLVFKG